MRQDSGVEGVAVGELALAWAGVRHRLGPWLLLALGAALAAAMPLAAAALQDRAALGAVEQAVAAVPDPSRGVLAVTSRDLRGPDLTTVSAQVERGLARSGLPTPTRALAFRSLSLQGTDTTVAALDPLADHVTLLSGRLPTGCSPTACEVLAVSSEGAAPGTVGTLEGLAGPARTLGLVVTGTATLSEPRLVGLGLVAPSQPLLLGTDPAAMADLEPLTLFGRNLAWFTPLDPAVVTREGPAAFAASLDQVAAEVSLTSGPLNVVWPSTDVLDAGTRGEDSAARFRVLGVGAGALQLGFCLVLAAARRPSARQHGTLLARRGARPLQAVGVATLQAGLAVLTGLLVTVATAVAAAVAAPVVVPGAGLGTGLGALGSAWPAVVGLAVAAVLGSVLLAVGPPLRPGVLRLGPAAVVLLAGGLATLALVRPTDDPRAPLPVAALVGLTLAVGLVAALLWSPLVALLGRAARGPGAPLRRVTLLAARRPLLPSLTAGFLAATLATAFLATSWSQSTQRSAEDRAASAVPLDLRVSPGSQVQLPATVVDAPRLAALGPDVVVSGVTSTTVGAFAGSSGSTSLPLAGVDPAVLPLVHRWSSVTGSRAGAAEVADRLRTGSGNGAAAAPVVPAGTRELVLDVRGLDADVTLELWAASPDGQERGVRLERRGPTQAYADLGGGPALTVRALEIGESADHLTFRQHGIGEGSTDRPLPAGTLRFGGAYADGHPVAWSWAGWGADSVAVRGDAAALSARYQIRDARAVLLPAWVPPGQRAVLPVAVDPVTAARAGRRGTFGITVNQTTVPVHVVAVLPRMPTLPARFVVADRTAVAALVDREAPGTAPVLQVWVSAPGEAGTGVRDQLAATASAATVQDRDALARTFADDPVTRGFVALLAAAGLVAFLLGLVAVVGGVRGDRETSAADLFALEVDGVGPGPLRRVLLTRAALVLAVGLPVGLAGGVGLALGTGRLLSSGPDGRPLTPPLQVVLASVPTAAVVLAAVVGTGLAALVTAATSLREARPTAPELDLR